MTQVIAMKPGFYGHLREAGDRFEIPDDEELGLWMVEANKDGSPKLTTAQKKGKEAAPVVAAAKPGLGSVPSSAPFTPAPQVFKVQHVPVGNFIVVNEAGEQVGERFDAVKGEGGKAKALAQAEADRLNSEAAAVSPISPVQAAQAQADEEPEDKDLPDA